MARLKNEVKRLEEEMLHGYYISKDERFNALLRQNVDILVNEERLREIVGLQNVCKNKEIRR